MREFLQRHKARIVAFTAVVLPLFLLYMHGRHPRRATVLEQALLQVTSPAQFAAAEVFDGLASVWHGYLALVDLAEENERLVGEVGLLTSEALRAKQLEAENQRLRSLLDFARARRSYNTVAAHVIGRDVSPFARVLRLRLDVGEDDEVAPNMAVVSREGLVGRIATISGRWADVMLSVDARSSVSVTVANKGITGEVRGAGLDNSYLARLLFLRKAKALEINDTLVTSGHDKIFPPGIEVGYIHSLEERQSGVYYEYKVAPAVNFSTLEEVLVITGAVDADATDKGESSAGGGSP